MTIKPGDKLRIRGIEGELLRVENHLYGSIDRPYKTEMDVILAHFYKEGDYLAFDEIKLANVKFSEIELIKEEKTEDNTMSNIKVTQARIDHLMNTAKFEVTTVFDKCTVVAAQFENGFVLVESCTPVGQIDYDKEGDVKICKEAMRDTLWQLESYALQKGIHKLTQEM